MHEHFRASFRLPIQQLGALDTMCQRRGLSRAALMREAVETYLQHGSGGAANLNRIAQTTEYIQVAIDMIVSAQMPEKRAAILQTVAHRMEVIHGAR